MTEAYQKTKHPAGDHRILHGHGGELELPKPAGEGLGEGAEGVVAYGGEDGRAGDLP